MRIALVALTGMGAELARRLAAGLEAVPGDGADLFLPARLALPEVESILCSHTPLGGGLREIPFTRSMGELAGELFARYRRIVFVMAVGIVVRAIAPHIRDKRRDPAVVVVDEGGRHAISLLSGHLGGANDLARAVARVTGGSPVITTATDVRGRPAIDLLARDLGWEVEPLEALRKVNAALLEGRGVVIYSEVDPAFLRERLALQARSDEALAEDEVALALGEAPVDGIVIRPLEDHRPDQWPNGGEGEELPAALVLVTSRRIPVSGDPACLFLRPRNLIAGVGCRRGTSGEAIKEAIVLALEQAGLTVASLRALASVDLKEDEAGLRAAATGLGLPLILVSRDEIGRLEEAGRVRSSPVVRERIGVGAVCEPAALLAGRKTELSLPKTTFPAILGVTVAIALETSVERSGWWVSGPANSSR